MRITANQVTFARLLVLPLPVWMIYQGGREWMKFEGGREWMLAALVVYVLLGLTDALDGYLARRYGATALGALLDPLADKIFLVAAFVPMADFRVAPPFLVLLLFVRELAVTVLRSIAIEEGFQFRTSAVAKLKTTVQMAGAGFMLLIWLFPQGRHIGPLLAVAAVLGAVPLLVLVLRGRRPGWMPISAAVLIASVGLARLLLDPWPAIFSIMAVILGFTVYSGLEYAFGMRRVLVARFRRAPIEALRLAGLSLAVPAFFLPALEFPEAPSYTTLCLLCAELASGGLDNSLTQAGVRRAPTFDLARSGFQIAAGLVVLGALRFLNDPLVARYAAIAAFAVTLGDVVARSVRNRQALRWS